MKSFHGKCSEVYGSRVSGIFTATAHHYLPSLPIFLLGSISPIYCLGSACSRMRRLQTQVVSIFIPSRDEILQNNDVRSF